MLENCGASASKAESDVRPASAIMSLATSMRSRSARDGRRLPPAALCESKQTKTSENKERRFRLCFVEGLRRGGERRGRCGGGG